MGAVELPGASWYCPNCLISVQGAITPWHNCAELAGMTAPLIREGTRAEITAVEREDYIGDEMVQTDDDGRPVMAVVTTRDDGQDCAVMAPTAAGVRW